MHHQGATGVKQKQKFTSIHILNTNLKLWLHNLLLIQSKLWRQIFTFVFNSWILVN
jgi:hypothetical protein